ncbi:MAG: hypothetical protein HUU35_10960, partial [Armatimonadetes bacterium]|nr:hypothetical protein [Armatimonadota bacterium]
MDDRLLCLLAVVLLPALAAGLEARVATRDGVPTLLVNGQPTPPLFLFHTAGSATAQACAVGPEWRRFGFSFRAPADDQQAALHIRGIAPAGDWYLDEVEIVAEGEGNLAQDGGFEGEQPPQSWTCFVNSSTGAAARFTTDSTQPQAGRRCLRVEVERPGTANYHIHLFQKFPIRRGREYRVALWLRSPQARTVEIQALHHGPPWTSYGGDSTPSDRIVSLGAERGLHLSTLPLTVPWPRPDQPADYAAAEAVVEHVLGVDPKALLVPRLHLDPPSWWKEAHPREQQIYDDGPHPMTSPASEVWRRDAEAALRGLLQHLEARYGEHMLGYHITAQSAGEWFYDHAWEKPLPCFEEPFRTWFAGWAERRYGDLAALRTAWQQPEVTFQSIRLPTAEERRSGGLGLFFDPRRQRFEIDFAEALQDCLADGVLHFARVVREVTGGRKLVVFFYGYLFEMAGFTNGPAATGHLKLQRLLDSPDIDLIAAPISYFDRQAGGSGPFMAAVDSIQAHGKLWINEDDTRTHLAPADAGFGRTNSEAESLGVYARNFGHQLERRCGTWWMDFGTGWMAHPAFFKQFGQALATWQSTAPAPFQPEVAVVVDEDSLRYLRVGNELTAPAINRLRRTFNQIGCPIGLYLLTDWCAGRLPDSVRCVYALNAWRLTTAQRAALRRERRGRTICWLYAPGYLDEAGGSAANVSDILGFEVVETGAPTPRLEPLP